MLVLIRPGHVLHSPAERRVGHLQSDECPAKPDEQEYDFVPWSTMSSFFVSNGNCVPSIKCQNFMDEGAALLS